MFRAASQSVLLRGLAALCLALPACETLPTAPVPNSTYAPLAAEPTLSGPDAAASESAGALYKPFAFFRNDDDSRALDFEFLRALNGAHPDRWAIIEARTIQDIVLACDDYRQFYAPPNLACSALGIGLAAPLANTPADRSIRNWYQRQVNRKSWDNVAEAVNLGGQLWIVLPVCMEAMALCGHAEPDYYKDGGLHEWSNRSLRAIAVGQPPVVALYVLLGSGRPDRGDSRWHPFRDIRGASGHTFTGALPFLTAASMTENVYLKAALYAGSFATGWSRLHKDRHYFSQIAVGWWMAYLAVRSVDDTQQKWGSWSLVPATEEGPGLGVLFRF